MDITCAAVHGVTKSWTQLRDWTELNCGYYNKRRIPFISNEHGKSDGSFFYLFFQSMSSMLRVLEEKQRCIKTGPFKLPAHGKYARFQTEFQHNSTFWFANMRIFFSIFFFVPSLHSTPSFCTTMAHLKCLCMGEAVDIYDTILFPIRYSKQRGQFLYTLHSFSTHPKWDI